MGVMACDRRDCPNVMCNITFMEGRKYICYECYEELLKWRETWDEETPYYEVEGLILRFMQTPPGSTKPSENSPDVRTQQEFERLTKNCQYEW